MPSGSITLYGTGSKYVFAGGDLEGEVTYTASKSCTLKDVKLKLVCTAVYKHDGKKKYKHKKRIAIPLLHDDGKTVIQEEEKLTRNMASSGMVYNFWIPLSSDLLPSTSGGCSDILDVSYKLKLSSKKVWFFRKKDHSTPITVVSKLDLSSPPFSEMAWKEIKVQDMRFGEGFDLLASALIPRQGWEASEKVPVQLSVDRISKTNPQATSHTIGVYLERTISYQNKTTIRDVAQSIIMGLPVESGPYNLDVVIPADTPVSGVMYCSTLSIRYRLRVEIKCAVNSHPSFILDLPLVIGTKQQLLTASPRSAAKGGSREDHPKGPGQAETDNLSGSSHMALVQSNYSTFDKHLPNSGSGRTQPRSGDSRGHRSERPIELSPMGTPQSRGQSNHLATSAERQQQPLARNDRHRFSFSQQLPASSSVPSQSELSVVNHSSWGTSRSSSQRSCNSHLLEPSSTTHRKQTYVSPTPQRTSHDWQSSLRCYDHGQTASASPSNPSLSPPSQSSGVLGRDPSTEVKRPVSPQPASKEHWGPEVDTSDKEPLCPRSGAGAKKAKKLWFQSNYSTFDKHLPNSGSGRTQPRSGDSRGHRSERPIELSPMGTPQSRGQSNHLATSAERQQQPLARNDRHRFSFSQQLPASSSVPSQSELSVVNHSSWGTSRSSSQRSCNSHLLEPSSATHRKQTYVSPTPQRTSHDWQSSLRCYDHGQTASASPSNPSLSPPSQSSGVLGRDPSTEVKRPVSPQPASKEHWGPEVDTSDKEPLCPRSGAGAKKAKKRRSSRSIAEDSC